ncbi:MAG: 3-hydroxyacyl-ACP dehydratase FabZ family protein [Bdellovibrionota bacterium]|nr:3-hydroxyacyl-ACP dehydratase FabZ family protein [Bdellovibrionota bacterium]
MKITIEEVKEFLPHRDPFLFVDSISNISLGADAAEKEKLEVKDVIGSSVIGHYFTRPDHPIFEGHFPDMPILPGVVQVEMMAQMASFALMKVYPRWRELTMDVMLLAVNNAKFRKPVFPDMELEVHCTCEKVRGPFMTNTCQILHKGEVMSEASVMASVKFTEKES